jgi:glucose-1-phosphate thymidylyltransferase
MTAKGMKFSPGKVDEWLDCGNKNATVYSNQRVLENTSSNLSIPQSASLENSVIIQPCFIGENVSLTNTVIGPHVSLGNNSSVADSRIRNAIIQENSEISNAVIENSMLGHHSKVIGSAFDLSISDYSTIES